MALALIRYAGFSNSFVIARKYFFYFSTIFYDSTPPDPFGVPFLFAAQLLRFPSQTSTLNPFPPYRSS